MDQKTTELCIKIGLITITFIIICILLIKRFVYFRPSRNFVNTVKPYKVFKQGHIHGWFLQGSSDKIVLFCHGNAGNISYREHKISELQQLGYSVIIFDYSGYGRSDGVPNEQQCYDDACTMVEFIRQKYKPQEIILYGESMGASIAAYAARRYNIPVLIMESPLPSIKSFIKHRIQFLSFLSFLFPEFDTELYLRGYKGRSLMLHSTTDEIINYHSVLQLQNMTTKFIPMSGTHNNPNIPWDSIHRFIENQPEQ